jgi:hypothetical protein
MLRSLWHFFVTPFWQRHCARMLSYNFPFPQFLLFHYFCYDIPVQAQNTISFHKFLVYSLCQCILEVVQQRCVLYEVMVPQETTEELLFYFSPLISVLTKVWCLFQYK